MSLFRVAALLIMCGIALSAVAKSATPQDSATKQAAQPDDIPKSIAESVSGTLQFAEGNFIGLAEAMPEDKYSYIPTVGKYDGVRSFGQHPAALKVCPDRKPYCAWFLASWWRRNSCIRAALRNASVPPQSVVENAPQRFP